MGGHRYVDSPVTHKQNETLQIKYEVNTAITKKKRISREN